MSELPELVQALLDPKAYPDPTEKIELIQTHISYVFLAGDYVYKVKKPVDMGFLDFTTLEKRLFYCQKEIELNRRLCHDAYLGVVPITSDNGRITIDGRGEVEEYAVKMRRLPQEAMMDVLLTKNKVTPEMVAEVAGTVAGFHRRAETSDAINAFGNLDMVTKTTLDENFGQTAKYAGTIISREKYQHLKDQTGSYLRNNAALFGKRVTDGKIRDCHGDLHAAHICFGDKICIYDCIEFIDRLRYVDVAADVAFLAMDLDHYGRPDLSESFINAYIKESGDEELRQLLDFYKSYRAYVRGKVACFQYDNPHISDEEREKTIATARSYFELAESYLRADQVTE
jgi:aminoglycoside phosphotransferase family enzyme